LPVTSSLTSICSLLSVYVFNAVDQFLAQRIAAAINLAFFVAEDPITAVVDNLKMIKKDLIPGGPTY
jgi:hypothetical protein